MSDSQMSWEPSFNTGRSAETALGRRLLRVVERRSKLLLAAGAIPVAAILFIGSSKPEVSTADPVTVGLSSPSLDRSSESMLLGTPYPTPYPGQSHEPLDGQGIENETTPTHRADTTRGLVYAIALDDLPGLPPDVAPGTAIDLWVTWQPPVTKRPKVQLLIKGATVERISPPFTPDGPYVVDLVVTEKELPDLLYGDQLGALSAAVIGR